MQLKLTVEKVTIIIFLIVILWIVALWQTQFTPSDTFSLEKWIKANRATLAIHNKVSLEGVPEQVLQKIFWVKLTTEQLGLAKDEIFRCKEILFNNGSCIVFNFPKISRAKIIFDRPATNPYILSLSYTITIPDEESIPNFSDKTVASQAIKFLENLGGGFAQTVPGSSETFLSQLNLKFLSPTFLPQMTEELAIKYLGPLYKIGQLPKPEGKELPIDSIRLPKTVSDFPYASGLMLKGLKITPTPVVDWTEELKTKLRKNYEFSYLAEIWEKRQSVLATWVPQLSDDVGTLLGSGYIRFNRPEILPATCTLFTPMDELNLLRAFHSVGYETTPLLWYPKVINNVDHLKNQINTYKSFCRQINDLQIITEYIGSASTNIFDAFFHLSEGHWILPNISSANTVFLMCSSSTIEIKEINSQSPWLIVSEGGNIIISGQKVDAHLICRKDSKGKGGKLVFRSSSKVNGFVQADTIEIEGNQAIVEVAPAIFPLPNTIPMICEKLP